MARLLLPSALSMVLAMSGMGLSPMSANAQASQKREMVSWVVLSNTPVELTIDRLREKLDELYPGQFLPPRKEGNFVIDGTMPGQFLIHSNLAGAAGLFLLNSVPGPYTDVSDFALAINDRSLRRTAHAQCCWLSVDLIHRHTTNEDAYRFIGRVLAKLAPNDAAALVHPSSLVTIPFSDDVRRRLASGQPFVHWAD